MIVAIPISLAAVCIAAFAWDAVRRAIELRRSDDRTRLDAVERRLRELERGHAELESEYRQSSMARLRGR